jgi:hypothetical protein
MRACGDCFVFGRSGGCIEKSKGGGKREKKKSPWCVVDKADPPEIVESGVTE